MSNIQISIVIRELLAGPMNTSRLVSVVPYEAQLDAVFIDDRGNAFVDLTAPAEPLNGSNTELLLAYGVVPLALTATVALVAATAGSVAGVGVASMTER